MLVLPVGRCSQLHNCADESGSSRKLDYNGDNFKRNTQPQADYASRTDLRADLG
mgnify:CR=1 FL=1